MSLLPVRRERVGVRVISTEQTHPEYVQPKGNQKGDCHAVVSLIRPQPRSLCALAEPCTPNPNPLHFAQLAQHPRSALLHRNIPQKQNEATAGALKPLQHVRNAVFVPPLTLFFDETKPPSRGPRHPSPIPDGSLRSVRATLSIFRRAPDLNKNVGLQCSAR